MKVHVSDKCNNRLKIVNEFNLPAAAMSLFEQQHVAGRLDWLAYGSIQLVL